MARAGVKKLLIFNAHGGNVSSMDIVARQLRMQCGLLVYHSSWFNLPQPAGVNEAFSAHEHRFGVHGGETETSMMLHLAPELVRMEHARNFASSSEVRARQFPILGNGKVPSWAGPCRTTTLRAQRAMPLPQMHSAARHWCRGCCQSGAAVRRNSCPA